MIGASFVEKVKDARYVRNHPLCLSWRPGTSQRNFIISRARQKILLGGTRSGKTDCCFNDFALQVLGVKGLIYPGFPADGVGVDAWASALDTSKWEDTLLPKIRAAFGGSWRQGGFIRREWKADGIIEITNGRAIKLRTNESKFEKFQSAIAPLILFDEYPPEDIYKECVMRTAEKRGCVMVAATPTRGTGWLSGEKYENWLLGTNGEEREHGGIIFVALRTEDNAHIPPTVVEDIKREYKDPDELEARLHGKHFVPGGLVFRDFDFNKHTCEPRDLPSDWPRFRGFDWGIRSPSTCYWIAMDPAERAFYAYREVYKTNTSVPAICKEVLERTGEEKILADLLDPSCWNRKGADEAGAWLDTAQEYMNCGIPVLKGNNAWHQGIQRLQTLFREGRFTIFRTCPNLIREVRRYAWPEMRTNANGELVQAPETRSRNHDHGIDPCRYIVMATPDYEGLPQQEGFRDAEGSGFRGDPDADEFRRHMGTDIKYVDGKLVTVAVVRKGPAPDDGLRTAGGTGFR